jgi:hypothetical protein
MRLEATTAIIAAAASLVGSAVGGALAYVTSDRLQDERDERDRAGARAIGMLEANRFQTLDTELRVMESEGVYLSRDSEIKSDFSSQDLALIVARLTRKQSTDLADARVCVSHLGAEMRGRREGEALDPIFKKQIRTYRECTRAGQRALAPLIDTEPLK